MKSKEDLFYEWVGKRISDFRSQKGLTQEALGSKIDLSRTSVFNVEKGQQRPPLYTIWMIAENLGVPPSSFLPLNNEHLPPDFNEHIKSVERLEGLKDEDKLILVKFLTKH